MFVTVQAGVVTLVLVGSRVRFHAVLCCDLIREKRWRMVLVARLQCKRSWRAVVFSYVAVGSYKAEVNSQTVKAGGLLQRQLLRIDR